MSVGTYVREKELGAGAFGKVYRVRNTKTNFVYAEKVIKCKDNVQLTNVLGEMKTLSKLSHPNIMKLYETKFDQKRMFEADLCLVFEYCSNGTLNDRLRRFSSAGVNMKWSQQISNAVAYLHSENLVHRDLKPENILLTSSEDIKVGDFGLSREYASKKLESETWESYYMKNGCGTLFYLAPEVFSGHYTEKADVFALGILLYAIAERCFLQVHGTKYYGAFVTKNRQKVPLGLQMFNDKSRLSVSFTKCRQELASIICSALHFEAKKRSSSEMIRQHLKEHRVK